MNYEEKRKATASRIARDGKLLTLRYPGDASLYTYAFDVVTGIETWTLIAAPHTVYTTNPVTPADYAVHAVELSYTDKDYANENIKVGDRKFMVSALSDSGAVIPKPNVGATLYVGTSSGTALAIVKVDPLEPGDTAIYYTVQARG